MKKQLFSFLLCFIALLTIGQDNVITAADIGLPDNVYQDLKNVVFTQEFEQCSQQAPGHNPIELTMYIYKTVKNGVTTVTEEVVVREYKYRKPGIRDNVGVYCLSLVAPLVNDNGYKNISKTDSGYVFARSSGSQLIVWNKSDKWYSKFAGAELGFRLMHPKTKQTRWYSATELLTFRYIPRTSTRPIAMTMAMIEDWSKRYRIGEQRDPSKYVCNILTKIVKLDNPGQPSGTYRADIYVNEKNINTFNEGALITSFGTTGMSFSPRWKFLNGCIQGDGGKMNGGGPTTDGTMDYGNGGTCGSAKGSPTDDFLTINVIEGNSFYFDGQTVTYNRDKPFWLWSMNETYQAQGKNEQTDGYYDVTNQRIKYSLFGS